LEYKVVQLALMCFNFLSFRILYTASKNRIVSSTAEATGNCYPPDPPDCLNFPFQKSAWNIQYPQTDVTMESETSSFRVSGRGWRHFWHVVDVIKSSFWRRVKAFVCSFWDFRSTRTHPSVDWPAAANTHSATAI